MCWTLPHDWKAVDGTSFYTPLWQKGGGTCQITLVCNGGYGTPYLYSGIDISKSYASGSLIVILG